MQNNYSGILLLLFLLAACRKDNANGALAPQPDPPVSPPTSDNTINKMTVPVNNGTKHGLPALAAL